jgi:hypothetical protein
MNIRGVTSTFVRAFRRPWAVHLAWFIALSVTCTGGFVLGASTMRWGVSPVVWQGVREAQFAKISQSLADLETNDLSFSEGLAIDRLRTALIALASKDDGWLCANYQSQALVKAKTWFDAHPEHHATRELQPFIAEGLRACEKRMWPQPATSTPGMAFNGRP